ncbi:MAG TPA: SDR family oxidoreductase [bacterium (Candidatus Stahlbacteria)]|nr:SDR family oxidoreductase [Candidatus Stahlbacteria bacterium]
MRILITGGAGFIGSHLAEYYLNKNEDVVVIDNLITGKKENLPEDPKLNFIKADINDNPKIDGPFDIIFHLASPASPKDYLDFPIETMTTGSIGTINTLEWARDFECRYIFASTSEVYGDPSVHPQDESYFGNVNPIGPRSVYDEAKRFGEAITSAYRRRYGLKTTIIRIFNTYGPRMKKTDGRAVPTFVEQAIKDKSITIFGDGSQTRSFCYIDDLIRAIIKISQIDHPGPVNLGNPTEYTILELAKLIIKLTNSKSKITYQSLPEDDPQRRCPDIKLAQSLIDWQPQVSLEDGLKRYVGWVKNI